MYFIKISPCSGLSFSTRSLISGSLTETKTDWTTFALSLWIYLCCYYYCYYLFVAAKIYVSFLNLIFVQRSKPLFLTLVFSSLQPRGGFSRASSRALFLSEPLLIIYFINKYFLSSIVIKFGSSSRRRRRRRRRRIKNRILQSFGNSRIPRFELVCKFCVVFSSCFLLDVNILIVFVVCHFSLSVCLFSN